MGWLQEEVENAIKSVLQDLNTSLLDFADSLFSALLDPIVGVPAPESSSRYIVVGAPDNEPWQTIYSDLYVSYILPLTVTLLLIGLAYVGVRTGSMSDYRRKRLLRRVGLVFVGTFVWFPMVSMPLQFVDAIGVTLAPLGSMSSDFGSVVQSAAGGLFVVLLIVIVSNVLLVAVAFVYALRWLAILVLTPIMPLLGVFWAFDVWPLSPASNVARRAAGVYPGLVVAGLPAAVLFRIGWQMDLAVSASGLFALFLGLILIPAACLASIMTVYWSSPAIKTIAKKGATKTNPAAAAAAGKKSVGKTVRGARNVHRGLSENASGAVTKSGQTTFGSGGSRAYQLGASVRAAKDDVTRYNNLRASKTGRMRDKAKADAKRTVTSAKRRSKQSFRNTKQKVSRW